MKASKLYGQSKKFTTKVKSPATFPPEKNAEPVEILKNSTKIKKFEAIDIRLNELAEWGPG